MEKVLQAETVLKNVSEAIDFQEWNDAETLLEIIPLLKKMADGKQTADQLISAVSYLKASHGQMPVAAYKLEELEDVLSHLALSLNQGKNKDSFVDTYNMLKKQYQEDFPNQTIDYHMMPFSRLKARYQLEFVKETANQLTGTFKEERIYYQNEVIANKIWPIVWEEYGYLHDTLAAFLSKAISSKHLSIAPRVEEVITDIANNDFESGLKKLIHPMAKSMNMAENQIARRVLIRLYEQPRLKMKILLLLKNWLFSKNRRLELTALLALQSKIGIENFKTVLAWLLDLYSRSCSYPQAFYISLLYLSRFVYKNEEFEKYYYRTLIQQLNDWSDEAVF